MLQHGDGLRRGEHSAADVANQGFGITLFGAGGSLTGHFLLGMGKHRDGLLGLHQLSAQRAPLAVRQTGFGAGGCLAGNSFALMAQGGNRLRRGDDLTADAAFCTGGTASLFTAGLHSRDFL